MRGALLGLTLDKSSRSWFRVTRLGRVGNRISRAGIMPLVSFTWCDKRTCELAKHKFISVIDENGEPRNAQ